MIRLEAWTEEDYPLVEKFLRDPRMMAHLGGPQDLEAARAQHRRLLGAREFGKGCAYKILLAEEESVVGSVVYWETVWNREPVYEIGWSVFPEFQGRGLATQAAAAALAAAREAGRLRYLHAFPAASNSASNAVCRKLGFDDLGECEIEYPAGRRFAARNWRLDLLGSA
jgi:RimJ/RimL family protein N-acetyltransferase